MVDQVLNLMVTGLDAVISWWSDIMTSTGMTSMYVTIMSVVLTIGILLTPILGSLRDGLSSGSDRASSWIYTHKEDRKHTTKSLQNRKH